MRRSLVELSEAPRCPDAKRRVTFALEHDELLIQVPSDLTPEQYLWELRSGVTPRLVLQRDQEEASIIPMFTDLRAARAHYAAYDFQVPRLTRMLVGEVAHYATWTAADAIIVNPAGPIAMHLSDRQSDHLRAIWRVHKLGAGGQMLMEFGAPRSAVIDQLAPTLRGVVAELNSISKAYLCDVKLSPAYPPLSVMVLRPAPELEEVQRQHLRKDLSEIVFEETCSCHVMLMDQDLEKVIDTVGLPLHPGLAA